MLIALIIVLIWHQLQHLNHVKVRLNKQKNRETYLRKVYYAFTDYKFFAADGLIVSNISYWPF